MRLPSLHKCPRGTIVSLGCPRIRPRLHVVLVSEGARSRPAALRQVRSLVSEGERRCRGALVARGAWAP